MFTKQVILVAGFDYENAQIDFSAMCTYRMQQLTKKFAGQQVRFTIFDVGQGTVQSWEPDAKGKVIQSDTTHIVVVKNPAFDGIKDLRMVLVTEPKYSFTAVTSDNFSDWADDTVTYKHFDQKQAGIMSITDIYEYLRQIGAGKDAGTVVECSFFSHGFWGGPVLVNSSDATFDDPSKPRDPNDKDPRYYKDFEPKVMDADALAQFKKAFAKDGFTWGWGCLFAKVYNIIIAEIFRNPTFKSNKDLKDTDKFELEYSLDKDEKDGAKRFDEIKDTLKAYGKLNKSGDFDVKMTMKDIKDVFKKALDDTFAQKLATVTNLASFGAFTGTYADPFDGLMSVIQDNDKTEWVKVEKKKKHPEPFHTFSKTIDFYIKYLGRTKDPEDRGYCKYIP